MFGQTEGLEILCSVIGRWEEPSQDSILPCFGAYYALATLHEIEFLLTWNCKHIANLLIQKDMARIMMQKGFRLPTVGTPESLMGGQE